MRHHIVKLYGEDMRVAVNGTADYVALSMGNLSAPLDVTLFMAPADARAIAGLLTQAADKAAGCARVATAADIGVET